MRFSSIIRSVKNIFVKTSIIIDNHKPFKTSPSSFNSKREHEKQESIRPINWQNSSIHNENFHFPEIAGKLQLPAA